MLCSHDMAESSKVPNYNSLVGQVPKLTKDNYYDWKFGISLVLWKANCWDVIQNAKKDRSGDWKVTKDAVDKADEALTIIGLTLDPSQYKLVNQCENGVEAWYKLADHYEKNSRANRIRLTRAFYNFKHDLDMPIDEYIQGLEAIWNQMRGIGMSITDSDLADALIMNLNSNFNSLASSLTSRGSEPEVAEVMDVLRDEEARLGMNGDQGESPKAFNAGRRRPGDKPVCWNCNKEGHYRQNCRENRGSKGTATMASIF